MRPRRIEKKRSHTPHLIAWEYSISHMLRRSLAVLAKQSERQVVRDPRKRRLPVAAVSQQDTSPATTSQQNSLPRQPLPFEPSNQNQQSVGSSLASYMLAGAGVAIGFTIVGAIFGG